MPVSLSDLRTAALALPRVEEGVCHGTPAFYVRGKLLARLQEDGETLSIACSQDDREALMEKHSDVFSITDHFRAYDYILMSLPATTLRVLGEMFESAWRRKAAKRDIALHDSLAA